MTRSRKSIVTLAAILAGFASGAPVHAGEVFRWVDDEGVVHFSQWAPEDADGVTTMHVTDHNPPDYDPADDPYSIGRQAERTNETWKTLEARRDERREKRREARERAAEVRRPYEYEPYPYYSPPLIYRPSHRPIYPPVHLPIDPPWDHPRPPHVSPPINPPRPIWPVKPPGEWTDPFRSAHIGVRGRTTVSY